MSCKLSDKCDNIFACNVLRPEVELLGCSFYKPKEPMTNEEWLKGLDTEQLAEFLCNVGFENETIVRKFKSEWERWLKQPHTDKE